MAQFSENHKDIITIPKYEDCFIYFLLDEGEVIYIGQTKNGLIRPLSHRDKKFDEIKILYCNSSELDLIEDRYIQKYKPIHNKQSNYAVRWGLLRARNCIRKITGINNYTVPRLRKVLEELNITPAKDCYNGKETISFDEYRAVVDYLTGGRANGRITTSG